MTYPFPFSLKPAEPLQCAETMDIRRTVCDGDFAWVSFFEPITKDMCPQTSLVDRTHDSGDPFPLGTTRVTYTYGGGDGSIVECQFNVIVSRSKYFFVQTQFGGNEYYTA